MSYLSRVTYTADGTTNIFNIPFPYLAQTDVYCTINGTPYTSYTYPTASTIQLGIAAAALAGYVIVIYRQTAISAPDVVFQGPSLDPADLNTQVLQLLYAVQEANDAAALYEALTATMVQQEVLSGLPTTQPTLAGVLWDNGGVLSVS